MTHSPAQFSDLISQAASFLDKEEVIRLSEILVHELPSEDKVFDRNEAKKILSALRKKRYFSLILKVSDALITNGQDDPLIRRQLSQAYIDSGHNTGAISLLEKIVEKLPPEDKEYAEAKGLMGRVYKQIFVNHPTASKAKKVEALKKALLCYKEVYEKDDSKLWHGINVVALLARAKREDFKDSAFEFADYKKISRNLLETIEKKEKPEIWDYGTAMEASLALGNFDQIITWAKTFVDRPDADAFELSSTIRQLEEVWQLSNQTPTGEALLTLLKAALLEAEGGVVKFNKQDIRALEEHQLQRVLGDDIYQPIKFLMMALNNCKLIGAVTKRDSTKVGTGFVLNGKSLSSHLEDRWYFLTNSHVVTNDEEVILRASPGRKPLRPNESFVSFELLFQWNKPELSFEKLVWTSPPHQLDASLLLLKEEFYEQAPKPYPISPQISNPEENKRVYIAGHPGKQSLSISLHDNHLLAYNDKFIHYRTPTDPGSSGSPVFNDQWELIGLHHAGGEKMPSLSDPQKLIEANEGIRIKAIMEAIDEELALKD